MKLNLEINKFVSSLSLAIDYVEKELIDVEPYHDKRVAYLTYKMGKHLNMENEKLSALTKAAVLHDVALSEYISDENVGDGLNNEEINMSQHCVVGEEILKKFPFYNLVEGAVLYHHDAADGSGAFGKIEEETPLVGQIIHMADIIDVKFHLYDISREKYEAILKWIESAKGTIISEKCANAFIKAVSYEDLQKIEGEHVKNELEHLLPEEMMELSMDVVKDMASVFASITDYKSPFTCRHSIGIAEKAFKMGQFYGYDQFECDKLYVAGALHDVGKLLVSNDILEKPDKLTDEEYAEIQNHAIGTDKMLSHIKGMEDIARWAVQHHEKLDGTGYPYKLTGEYLDKNSRTLACLDIYQALVEDRPYKKGMSHEVAMGILKKMGEQGKLDSEVIADVDKCFGQN